MTAVRISFVLVAMTLAAGHASGANLFAEMYDPQELTRLQAIYSRGWLDNFNNVFLPAMTPEERAGVGAARFWNSRSPSGSLSAFTRMARR